MSTARFMQEATEPDAQLRPRWPGSPRAPTNRQKCTRLDQSAPLHRESFARAQEGQEELR